MTKINIDKIEELIKELLIQIGEDPQREGIINTPERVAKAWQFLAKGYNQDLDSLRVGIYSIIQQGYTILFRSVRFHMSQRLKR